jgi:hypothetical protein
MARPKGDPTAVRTITIGVRVSPTEYATLREKAAAMAMTPAQWLRSAALSRRLPASPVSPINLAEYGRLTRLSANLNQLVRLAHEGEVVGELDALLQQVFEEVRRLRQALLGLGPGGGAE